MIDNRNFDREFKVNCDGCSYSDLIEADSFKECIQIIKSDGWNIRLIRDEWCHFCPCCVEQGHLRLKGL